MELASSWYPTGGASPTATAQAAAGQSGLMPAAAPIVGAMSKGGSLTIVIVMLAASLFLFHVLAEERE